MYDFCRPWRPKNSRNFRALTNYTCYRPWHAVIDIKTVKTFKKFLKTFDPSQCLRTLGDDTVMLPFWLLCLGSFFFLREFFLLFLHSLLRFYVDEILNSSQTLSANFV